MPDIQKLLNENTFLQALFESIPCSVMIVDENNRVEIINSAFQSAFHSTHLPSETHSVGELIKCRNHLESQEACGFTKECLKCQLLATAREALSGDKVHRKRTKLQLGQGDAIENHTFLLSAAPIEFPQTQMAIVIMEDITELDLLKHELRRQKGFAGLIGQDPQMLELYQFIKEVADVDVPVLLQGESGTGKELVARAIHTSGNRAAQPFVPINCGALPENLLESELFGHVRGAFTGAIRDKRGRFEIADEGTIFLDEIGELSFSVQVKLLRVLQEGTFEKVGSEITTTVNVRVISATNKDLLQEVGRGNFREDLYYRLCVMPFKLPTLRERKSDIPLLVDSILQKNSLLNEGKPIKLSKLTMNALLDYDWPGNVRELQNVLQYSLVKCHGPVIELEHLPPNLTNKQSFQRGYHSKRKRKRKLDPETVRQALKKANGNKVETAKLLGVSRATLYRFIDATGI